MKSDKVNIGVIGVGQIGHSHLRKYKDIEEANIVAAADVDSARLASVAEEFAIPQTYTDFRELLKRDDIQAVDVCLHNNLHMPVTVAALEAGKDVYCEKPMAGAYIDAERMLETARELGRKLSVQLATLYSSSTRSAKILIEEGRLGRVFHARSTGYRRLGRPYVDGYGTASFVQKAIAAGGALYDMGVYHIAQILYLLGNPEVERISGMTYQETAIDARRLETSGYDVEELGMGFVRFSGDVTMDIIESWAVHMNEFEGSSIFGSEGGIRLHPFTYYHRMGDLLVDSKIDTDAAAYRWDKVHGTARIYASAQHHWINALLGRVELLPTAELALNTMLISEGIYLSARAGREVTAEEVRENSVSTSINLH